MMPLVECVPNFSEGRRGTVIAAIVAAIATQSVHILDVNRDADHNRSVVTFVGEADAVGEAAFCAIQTAAQQIDMTQHSGVHPRIGAADVVPFVPLRDTPIALCVELARSVGERVAAELGIPVYLYEDAALRPERRNLADVRRGGYETLREEIALTERQPDFGSAVIGSAGAVAIGARVPLIAFNAYLATDGVAIAAAIARQLRAANGGLPHVKAIGVLVGGRAQVSMNLTDYRQTSLFTVMTALHAAAAQQGTEVTETELIGLIPQAALLDYAIASLGLPSTTQYQTLETRFGAASGDYRPLFE
jgi:glutamate formiminotransferase